MERHATSAATVIALLLAAGCGAESAADPDPASESIDVVGATASVSRQPVVLAATQGFPNGLAVDATSVYWTTADGFVRKVPIAGGKTLTLASGQRSPFGIAVDAKNVYWTNADTVGQVMSVPIAGGAPRVLADNQPRPFKLAVANGTIYWTNNDAGTVMKMPTRGGTPTTLARFQDQPVAIAVDAHTLYWSIFNPGTIMAMPLAGGAPRPIAPAHYAFSLFLRGGTLYWSDVAIVDGAGSVFKLTPGGAPVALAHTPGSDAAVADAANVYFTDEVSGSVMKAPLAGGNATVIAKDQLVPTEIAIDDRNVYWITANGSGTIMKLAK